MDEESSGAEQAFNALQSEVTIMRRAVEALPGAFKANRGTDYTPTLLEITQALKEVGQHLQQIERHPALQATPEQHQSAIVAAGEIVMREAVQSLERATTDAKAERQQLAAMVGNMRGQQEQLSWLLWVGVVALVLGLAISPVFAALLPFGLDGRVAALIMKTDRWRAGEALMAADSPEAWADLTAAAALLRPNKAALDVCREAAVKTKKEQRCPIVVPAPAI